MRELANFIERAVILTRGGSLEVPLTELRTVFIDEAKPGASLGDRHDIARIVKETINALDGRKSVAGEHDRKQRDEIVRALTDSKGRVGGEDGAAARLGINRTTLLSRMKKLDIHAKEFS